MKIHMIVDFMHIYYKYLFAIKANKLRRLTVDIEGKNYDISNIYYVLRDIENLRKNIDNESNEVTVSICFDSPSTRSDNDNEYKSNRVKRLGNDDFEQIGVIRLLLDNAGYNTYKEEGYEADDLITCLVDEYKDKFDETLVYTNDADLVVNVDDNVWVFRRKAKTGYIKITKDNYSDLLGDEFKTFLPYNSILIYKALCGDISDNIKGVPKLGKSKFRVLMNNYISENPNIDLSKLNKFENCVEIIKSLKLGDKDEEIALHCLELIIHKEVHVSYPCNISNRDKREKSYSKYNMKSLID